MNASDLLQTSRLLLGTGPGRPSGACCRRAVSGAYYAVFHCLARECANLLIGGSSAARSKEAWRQVYRALDHNRCKTRCQNHNMLSRYPKGIQDFANAFVTLQEKRHSADYDPFASVTKTNAESHIALAEQAIADFKAESAKDRLAFCVYALLDTRR